MAYKPFWPQPARQPSRPGVTALPEPLWSSILGALRTVAIYLDPAAAAPAAPHVDVPPGRPSGITRRSSPACQSRNGHRTRQHSRCQQSEPARPQPAPKPPGAQHRLRFERSEPWASICAQPSAVALPTPGMPRSPQRPASSAATQNGKPIGSCRATNPKS